MTQDGVRKLPLYQRVAGELREAILSGDYQPGDRLPSYTRLSRGFDVSVMTVKQVLVVLKQEGLIETQPKRGVFVRLRRPFEERLGLERFLAGPEALPRLSGAERSTVEDRKAGRTPFASDVEAAGRVPSGRVVEVSAVVADQPTAALLRIAPGDPVVRRRRVDSVDGVPVQMVTSFVPAQVADGTAVEALGAGSVWAQLEEAGHAIDTVVEQLSVGTATPEECTLLQVPADTSLLRTRQWASAAGDAVLAVDDVVTVTERYTPVYRYKAR